jgi:hypothetical protein
MMKKKKKNSKRGGDGDGKKIRGKCWLVGSPEHTVFVALRENKKWLDLKHLPIRGSKEATELDRFMDTGIQGQPLSRNQVNRKFRLWIKSHEEEKKLQELDPTKIQSAASLMDALKKRETWVFFVSRQRIYAYDEKSPAYVDVIGADSWLIRLLEVLRTNVLDSVATLMLHADDSETDRMSVYTDDEKCHLQSFITSFLSEFLEQESVKTWLEKENGWIAAAGKDEKHPFTSTANNNITNEHDGHATTNRWSSRSCCWQIAPQAITPLLFVHGLADMSG